MSIEVAVAKGDGIGPEIMDSVLEILDAAKVPLVYTNVEIGEKIYLSGNTSGIEKNTWEVLKRTKVLLKSPITTPQGGGYKSLNVTIRKTLGLFANVRPCRSYWPAVKTTFPKMDLVIIRENEEDLYAGIEHRQTEETYQCLKLVTKSGCERIIRYAFEYALVNNRKKVSCMSKDNIMKLTDGLFHKIFNEVAKEYPTIENDHYIIDIGAARLATDPERFDVIVTMNLYGDIISDIAAEVAGSVGLAGSANIGTNFSMFEAIHGSAPDIAGKNLANPSALLMGSIMMLLHLGLSKEASKIQNALLKTLEEGFHTGDIFEENTSKKKVSTKEFTEKVISNLGELPKVLTSVSYNSQKKVEIHLKKQISEKKELVGVDVFVDWNSNTEELAAIIKDFRINNLSLKMITNRGLKVWPDANPDTLCSDHWRCRFKAITGSIKHEDIISLLSFFNERNIDFIKTEHLYNFSGIHGYSMGQGQ